MKKLHASNQRGEANKTSSHRAVQVARTDGLNENAGHEFDGREIDGQDIYRLRIDYITMQRAILFKITAEHNSHNSKVSCKICLCIIMLKCIHVKFDENINLKLATGDQR